MKYTKPKLFVPTQSELEKVGKLISENLSKDKVVITGTTQVRGQLSKKNKESGEKFTLVQLDFLQSQIDFKEKEGENINSDLFQPQYDQNFESSHYQEFSYYNYTIKILSDSDTYRLEAHKNKNNVRISFLHEKIMEVYLSKVYNKSSIDFTYRTLLDFSKDKVFLNKEQLIFIENKIKEAQYLLTNENFNNNLKDLRTQFITLFSGFHQELYDILRNLKNTDNLKNNLSIAITKLEKLKELDYESAIIKREFSHRVRLVRQI